MLKRILASLDSMIDSLMTNKDTSVGEIQESPNSAEYSKNSYAVTHTGNRHGTYYLIVVDGDDRVPLDCTREVYHKIERLAEHNPDKYPVIKAKIDSANLIVNRVYSYSLICKSKVAKTEKEEREIRLEENRQDLIRELRRLSKNRREDII